MRYSTTTTTTSEALEGPAKLLALQVVAVGNFLVMLAMTPVSTILPTITAAFEVKPETAAWVLGAYLLFLTSFVLTAGRLGDLFGSGRVYAVGIAIFTVAATLGGFSQNIYQLIGLRALQGVGAALMMGNSLAILAAAFPDNQRGSAMGVAGMAASAGSIIGAGMAVMSVNYLSWQWIFYAMAPIGAISFVSSLTLREKTTNRAKPEIDFRGMILWFLTLATFSLSLSHLHGGEESFQAGWPYHTVMQLLAVFFFAAFLRAEKRAAEPLMPFALFRNPLFTTAIAAYIVLHMTMMGSQFLIPFLIERSMGLTPNHTGVFIISKTLVLLVFSYIGGYMYDRTRSWLLRPISMAILCLCLVTLAILARDLHYGVLIFIGFFLGAGMGIYNTINSVVAMSAPPEDLRGFGSGMLETAKQLGHTMAVAAVSAAMSLSFGDAEPGAIPPAAYTEGFALAVTFMASISFLAIVLSVAPEIMKAYSRRFSAVPARADETKP